MLFGDYEWNKRLSASVSELDLMSYEERLKLEGGQLGWWKREDLHDLPLLIKRCATWDGVADALVAVLSVESSVA